MGTYVPPLPLQHFVPTKTVVTSLWLNQIDSLLQGNVPATGVYTSVFNSGQVQLTGPNGYMTSYGDFLFGLTVPGPGGSGPSLLLGGASKPFSQIITDEQIPGLKGINLYIAAGESAPGDLSGGGDLWLFGGASSGPGGQMKIQGGTSTQAAGGDVQILGGNSTVGSGPAGNVYILAGTEGNAGGNVKIYATKLNNTPGDISFWLGQPDAPHSVPLWTMSHTGALFPGNQGAGNPGDVLVSAGNLDSPSWGAVGIQASISMVLSGSVTPTSGSVLYCTNGRQVSLWIENFMTGSANGNNDLILSTLPSFLIPSLDRYIPCSNIMDGGIGQYQGVAHVDTLGAVRISLLNLTNHVQQIVNAFNSVGEKGLTTGWCITYPL